MRKMWLLILLLVLLSHTCYAETKEIVAEGTYIMGDGETSTVAQDKALLNAKRTAIEQAGIYIESYSQTVNYQLTKDEINTLSSGMMQITTQSVVREFQGNTLKFIASIHCYIQIDDVAAMRERVRQLRFTAKQQEKSPIYDDENLIERTLADGRKISYNRNKTLLTVLDPSGAITVWVGINLEKVNAGLSSPPSMYLKMYLGYLGIILPSDH